LGYIALGGLKHAISPQAYYFALRVGRAAEVAPIATSDPIWAAGFAMLFPSVALRHGVVLRPIVNTASVVILAR
jgi:uncharacterized membrane protein